jgi:hypothetical protein
MMALKASKSCVRRRYVREQAQGLPILGLRPSTVGPLLRISFVSKDHRTSYPKFVLDNELHLFFFVVKQLRGLSAGI